ncbi:hypothetical protein PR003_g8334 [Phytophthora rubi]|uniref:RxLR effector protein n=1 Tax=Phytophthora rubi TaxID=129364 RepID=A0A6A4FRB5_9STRA|nr:hypothetical protein PR002_g8141 [Phytophthora rubi]KAE9052175.1 hypothetical protein PR001_g751 [Phytophthora rubi]KAE9344683.1 hypothetical protein PR003_g8334 [Phytophthora rubi]
MPVASHHCVLLLVAYLSVRTCISVKSSPPVGPQLSVSLFSPLPRRSPVCAAQTLRLQGAYTSGRAPVTPPPPINDVAQLEERVPEVSVQSRPSLSSTNGLGAHAPTAFNHCATPDGVSLV